MSCKYLILVENACISEMHALCCRILILKGASEDAVGENAMDEDTITEDAEGKDAVEKMLWVKMLRVRKLLVSILRM